MICAMCYARYLMDEQPRIADAGIDVFGVPFVAVPAATTTYNGKALCGECFKDQIRSMPVGTGEMPTGSMND